MLKRIFIIVTLSGLCFYAHSQTYTVKKTTPGSIVVNGNDDDKAWAAANILSHFIYPWERTTAPLTSFSALWDGQWLYCLFTVKDDSINIYRIKNEKRETAASDRVEIFFKAGDKMQPYYCLEMDAAGRVLDYSAEYYRKMHYEWGWPKEQLAVKTSLIKDGYILEAAISISSLTNLDLLKDNRLQAGIFRAECTGIINGRSNLKWISWIDPKSAEPDFHIPAAFGTLILE